ncbi:hypothetical protein PoB_006042200 [Plakobranchus ocellatus]|uniref:Secreted protein n=1 Tax=Plakobranchus ocellatus TaxID=259542 RepID=A0AAV4CPU2_9GAST|nr:hypothetical protein PoB_006042200 [Plakobranchus ocellatus]
MLRAATVSRIMRGHVMAFFCPLSHRAIGVRPGYFRRVDRLHAYQPNTRNTHQPHAAARRNTPATLEQPNTTDKYAANTNHTIHTQQSHTKSIPAISATDRSQNSHKQQPHQPPQPHTTGTAITLTTYISETRHPQQPC